MSRRPTPKWIRKSSHAPSTSGRYASEDKDESVCRRLALEKSLSLLRGGFDHCKGDLWGEVFKGIEEEMGEDEGPGGLPVVIVKGPTGCLGDLSMLYEFGVSWLGSRGWKVGGVRCEEGSGGNEVVEKAFGKVNAQGRMAKGDNRVGVLEGWGNLSTKVMSEVLLGTINRARVDTSIKGLLLIVPCTHCGGLRPSIPSYATSPIRLTSRETPRAVVHFDRVLVACLLSPDSPLILTPSTLLKITESFRHYTPSLTALLSTLNLCLTLHHSTPGSFLSLLHQPSYVTSAPRLRLSLDHVRHNPIFQSSFASQQKPKIQVLKSQIKQGVDQALCYRLATLTRIHASRQLNPATSPSELLTVPPPLSSLSAPLKSLEIPLLPLLCHFHLLVVKFVSASQSHTNNPSNYGLDLKYPRLSRAQIDLSEYIILLSSLPQDSPYLKTCVSDAVDWWLNFVISSLSLTQIPGWMVFGGVGEVGKFVYPNVRRGITAALTKPSVYGVGVNDVCLAYSLFKDSGKAVSVEKWFGLFYEGVGGGGEEKVWARFSMAVGELRVMGLVDVTGGRRGIGKFERGAVVWTK